MGILVLFFLALSVKQDQTSLRSGCATDTDVRAKLSQGAPLTIRYSMSGESVPCYKVAVQVDGKTVEGYLSATEIEGLDEFDRIRRDAQWLDTSQMLGAIRATAAGTLGAAPAPGPGVAGQAAQLIETGQPGKALEILGPELRKKKDPTILALAGVAAWRSDDTRQALEYWRGSLGLQPNPGLETLVRRVERESKGDQSTDKIMGLRVVLRYESATVPAETARQMLATVDDAFIRISAQLGCTAEERIVAIVQSREAYRKSTDAAEWSGGQYDGRIRVPVLSGQGMDAAMRRTLAHETTHACLAMLGRWPAWLQEGLAQKLSGDTLPAAIRQKVSEMARAGQLPRLENLGQDWSRLDTAHATLAYAMSLAAVELFYENYGSSAVGDLVRHSDRLSSITADLDKRLGF